MVNQIYKVIGAKILKMYPGLRKWLISMKNRKAFFLEAEYLLDLSGGTEVLNGNFIRWKIKITKVMKKIKDYKTSDLKKKKEETILIQFNPR